MEKTTKFNLRSFTSMSMFIFIILLAFSGITMQVIDSLADSFDTIEEIPSYLIFISHFITAIHVCIGFPFAILSILHIILNWQALKTHFKKKTKKINKEVIFSIFLTIILISVALIFSVLD